MSEHKWNATDCRRPTIDVKVPFGAKTNKVYSGTVITADLRTCERMRDLFAEAAEKLRADQAAWAAVLSREAEATDAAK